MLFMEIIAVYSENHIKPINTHVCKTQSYEVVRILSIGH
jgi:hypothetical protein